MDTVTPRLWTMVEDYQCGRWPRWFDSAIALLDQVNPSLWGKGRSLGRGPIVDARIMTAPSSIHAEDRK